MFAQQGWRASKASSGGGGGLTSLPIQNTLFVSKNGDNSTGQRNLWDKPFLTIAGASAQSQVGDTIYVFSGDYTEGSNDWCYSDRYYYFEPNAKVIGFTWCIYDFGQARNIHIDGYGDFENIFLNFNQGAVFMTNNGSNFYIRAQRIHGEAQALALRAGTYDIKTHDCSSDRQYVCDIRGNCQGRFEWTGLATTNSTGAGIQCRALGTDNLPHKHVIIGGTLRTNSQAFGAGMISPILNQGLNVEIEFHNITLEHTGTVTTGGLIYLWNTGKVLFRNCNGISPIGYGINTQTGTTFGAVQFENCNLGGQIFAMVLQSNINISASNSLLIANTQTAGAGGAVALGGGDNQLDLDNCTIVQNANFADRSIINYFGGTLRMRYCKLIASAIINESIGNSGGVPRTLYIEGQCSTNKPVSALITNGIAGTNIIVDANVARNSNNYYNI